MIAKTTTKKKKPKCTKGTACGYSCVAAGKVCNQPVPKDVAEDDLSAIPAKGKKKAEPKVADEQKPPTTIKEAYERAKANGKLTPLQAVKDVDPLTFKMRKKDVDYKADGWVRPDNDEGVQTVKKLAEQAGVDPEVALAIGQATRAWLGYKYKQVSPMTYRPAEQLGDDIMTEGHIGVLAGTVAGLKVMPRVHLNNPDLEQDIGFENWDKETTNRWVNIPDVDGFTAKYKVGEVVTEDGMFGTSILPADQMRSYSGSANVTYKIKPKLDGTGNGRYVDHLKRSANEGEILYPPGTKFRVIGVKETSPIREPLENEGLTKENWREKVKQVREYVKKYEKDLELEFDREFLKSPFYGYNQETGDFKQLITDDDIGKAVKEGYTVNHASFEGRSKKVEIEMEEVATPGIKPVAISKKPKAKTSTLTSGEIVKKVYSKSDKSVTGALSDLDPLEPKLTTKDLGNYYKNTSWIDEDYPKTKEKLKKMAIDKGVDENTAEVYARSAILWGSYLYAMVSPFTYKPTKEAKPDEEDIAFLTGAVATLKLSPKATLDDPELRKDDGFNGWDKKTTNRFITVDDADKFAEKYKEGFSVTEDGMFATTIRNPKGFAFAEGANVRYRVKPKLDGTGTGHYIDRWKDTADGGKSDNGEILHEPGTKFRVTKVTKKKTAKKGAYIIIDLEEE